MTLLTFPDQGLGKFNIPTQQRIVLLRRPTMPLNTEPDCKFPGEKWYSTPYPHHTENAYICHKHTVNTS